jgi:hypothetical protein
MRGNGTKRSLVKKRQRDLRVVTGLRRCMSEWASSAGTSHPSGDEPTQTRSEDAGTGWPMAYTLPFARRKNLALPQPPLRHVRLRAVKLIGSMP